MKKEQIKQLLYLGLPIILGSLIIIGTSYAWLTLTLQGTKVNTLKVGTLLLDLDESIGNAINLTNAVPMYDEVGLTTEAFTFTLENTGTIDSEYTIYLDDVALGTGETKLPTNLTKYNLVKDGVSLNINFLSTIGESPNRVLDTGVISPKDKVTYELRLWLDERQLIQKWVKCLKES